MIGGAIGSVMGGIIGGVSEGISAIRQGNDFWNGTYRVHPPDFNGYMAADLPMVTITAPKPLPSGLMYKLSNGLSNAINSFLTPATGILSALYNRTYNFANEISNSK